jgi:N-acetylglucosamine-6-phosphate deacetylase
VVPPVLLRAARVLTPERELADGFVVLDGGRITEVGSGPRAFRGPVSDLGDRLIVPGFIDLHVHGGGGSQVDGEHPDEVAGAVRAVAAAHARWGTTALVATTVSAPEQRLVTALHGVAAVVTAPPGDGARVLGTHLEGPWLAPGKAGAQDPSALRAPTVAELHRLLTAAAGTLRLLTLAPELPGALDVVRTAAAAGVVVSVGHTEATVEQAARAFDAGARHATHLFNAMPPLLHRAPGPVGAARADPRVSVELVADGEHVHPAVLALVAAAARGRVVAVTDAVSATGLPDGRYRLGAAPVDVRDGRVTLAAAPGTLAGSVLTMDRAVRTLVAAGVPPAEAVTAATATPAGVLGRAAAGRLAPGADADLVVLDGDLRAVATVVAGRPVHDPEGLLGWT